MNDEPSSNPDCLDILTAPEADAAGIGDFLSSAKVPVKKLSKNLEKFTEKLVMLLPAIPHVKDYELSEVTVSVNVTAGGELQLIGMARGKGEVKGGLTLKFTKL